MSKHILDDDDDPVSTHYAKYALLAAENAKEVLEWLDNEKIAPGALFDKLNEAAPSLPLTASLTLTTSPTLTTLTTLPTYHVHPGGEVVDCDGRYLFPNSEYLPGNFSSAQWCVVSDIANRVIKSGVTLKLRHEGVAVRAVLPAPSGYVVRYRIAQNPQVDMLHYTTKMVAADHVPFGGTVKILYSTAFQQYAISHDSWRVIANNRHNPSASQVNLVYRSIVRANPLAAYAATADAYYAPPAAWRFKYDQKTMRYYCVGQLLTAAEYAVVGMHPAQIRERTGVSVSPGWTVESQLTTHALDKINEGSLVTSFHAPSFDPQNLLD